jgi:UDP-N-acetylmuramoylalanine-D-glutamate ligase
LSLCTKREKRGVFETLLAAWRTALHWLELSGRAGGASGVNDSIGTSVQAARFSVLSFSSSSRLLLLYSTLNDN